ncbi:hypothetical protein K1719_005673 [Acacia pycnantha]|nr:hypothetical protein K1719_005673 [Acacia pycnantha]
MPSQAPSIPSLSPEKSLPAKEEQFGPWMFVQKLARSRFPRKEGNSDRLERKRSGSEEYRRKNDGRVESSIFSVLYAAEDEEGVFPEENLMDLVGGEMATARFEGGTDEGTTQLLHIMENDREKQGNLEVAIIGSNQKEKPLDQAYELSQILGIGLTPELGKYLGVPILHKRATKLTFAPLIQKVGRKLANWKGSLLSMAGKIVLIKSVLSAIPYYQVQSVLIPKGILLNLEKMSRDFFWNHNRDSKKMHLISWNVMKKNKSEGMG